MAPRIREEHRPPIARPYLEELRRRVELAGGYSAVAAKSDMDKSTVWRTVNPSTDPDRAATPTFDAVERLRLVLHKMLPDEPALPPPLVAVLPSGELAGPADVTIAKRRRK